MNWGTATVTADGTATDGTIMDGTITDGTAEPGEMPQGGPMESGFAHHQAAEETEETVVVSTAKSLSEFSSETWILLGTSFLVLLAAILLALKFKRY